MSKILEVYFTVDIKELNSSLIRLSKLAGKFTKTSLLEIRVLRSGIEITSNGMTKKLDAKTNGEADVTLPVALLKKRLFQQQTLFAQVNYPP